MGVRQKIEDKIRRKEQELLELEATARDIRNYIQGLQDTVKLLPRDVDESDAGTSKIVLRAKSGPAMAKEFLERAGKPQHISEILKGIGKEVNRRNRVGLAGSLNNYARKGIIFTAEGSNVFGLIGMKPIEKEISSPPAGFGIMGNPPVEESDEDDESNRDLM